MSLKVSGRGTIHGVKRHEKFVTFGLSVGQKKQNGEWENYFWNCKAFGANIDLAQDKAKVDIEGYIEKSKYQEKEYININVNKMSVTGSSAKKEDNAGYEGIPF